MQTRCRRWITINALAPLVALSLSACGGASGPAEFTEAPTVLTKRQLNTALLTPADLGRGFVLDRSKDDDSDDLDDMGCLDDIDTKEAPEPAAEAEATYKRAGKVPFPAVIISVASFDSTGDMDSNMRAFREVLQACDNLAFKIDGVSFDIPMTTDKVPSSSAIDEQFNARGVGSITAKKVKVPFGAWFSMAKVGNQGVVVMVMDFNPSSGRLLTKLTAKTVKRLDAVANGDTPAKPKPTKPAPTASATPNA